VLIKLDTFSGLAPRIAPVDLPQQAAQIASNCLFGSGSLRPLSGVGPVAVSEPLVPGNKKTIFRYGDKWLAWLNDISVCRSAVAMDVYDRLYWTGDGVPKMGDRNIILSGSSKPGSSYDLGIPKPAAIPTASGTIAVSTSVTAESRAYVYTYVSAYGEEGPPSSPSALISVEPGTTVTISNMSAAPGGSHNIISKNIYRVNTGSTASEYQFVASVAVATPAYSDTIASSALGEVLPSATWIAPNAAMTGIVAHPGGFLVGFYKNVLCPSVPYLPHAYPAGYQITVDVEIIAIGVYGNSILVTTKGMPYVVTGSTPGQLSIDKLEKGEACILKRGFVDMGWACMYPGPSGLWLAGTGTVELATAALMTKKEWAAYSASLVFALQYESLYIGFMTSGGFIFDVATGTFSTHDITATGGWYDRENGKLFLVVYGQIMEWAAGPDKMLMWKSKKFQALSPANLGVAQIFASGPVMVKIYADGVLKHSQYATSSTPFRLPSGFLAINWEVQVEGNYEVTSVLLASTMAELAQV
jgi:hypothetical protein